MIYDEQPDNFLNSEDIASANSQEKAEAGNRIDFTDDGADKERRKERRKRITKIILWACLIVVVAIAGLSFYYYYPNVSDAQATGYIRDVERRGILFKTGESRLYPSTGSVPADSFITFSITCDSLFDVLQEYQSVGTPVTVTYKSSRGTLMWRGESNRIITSVKAAQPTDIFNE
ncbi:MAG: hypothetical protein J1E84_04760 [Muribaculaceae bacterium]|nr:hypothetical protein [Muribaculaceae bacterium]